MSSPYREIEAERLGIISAVDNRILKLSNLSTESPILYNKVRNNIENMLRSSMGRSI